MTKGFGLTREKPESIIKSMMQTRALRPQNLAETVQNLRDTWDDDYPYRPRDTEIKKEELFRLHNPSVEDMDKKNSRWNNPHHTVTQIKFFAVAGSWCLGIMEQANGQLDWDLKVYNGWGFVFHPVEAQNQILSQFDEDTLKEWKGHVMSNFNTSVSWLIGKAKEHIPGTHAWSVTCSESSERLCRKIPNVHVQDHVAFLIL